MKNNFTQLTFFTFLLFFSCIDFYIKADTYTVATLNDTGAGSLRQAILDANANTTNAPHIIDMRTLNGVINLQSQLYIQTPMSLLGSGKDNLRLRAAATGYRIMNISNQTVAGDFLIKDLTVSHGNVTVQNIVQGAGIYIRRLPTATTVSIEDCVVEENKNIASGAGIYGEGAGNYSSFTLEIKRSIIKNNITQENYGGGGICLGGINFLLDNCVIEGNQADYGGGIYVQYSQTRGTINNCLFRANSLTPSLTPTNFSAASALRIAGGKYIINNSTFTENNASAGIGRGTIGVSTGATQTLVMNHCTIYDNIANYGGAIYNQSTATENIEINNCIVTGNTAIIDNSENFYGNINSTYGHNVLDIATGGTLLGVTTGNVLNAAANTILNTTLADNGGNTPTFALVAGSPAINLCTDLLVTADQRGFLRDIQPDAGAFEVSVNVKGNGTIITNGDATPNASDNTDFGSVQCLGGSITKTFVIENQSSFPLIIDPILITGSTNFVVTDPIVSDPFFIPSNSSYPIQITFTATTTATQTAIVTIPNNNPTNNPYTFTIQATKGDDIINPSIEGLYSNLTFTADVGSCYSSSVSLGTPTLFDNCGFGSNILVNDAPATFPVGTTTVTWSIADESGNIGTNTQLVTVLENDQIIAPTDQTLFLPLGECGIPSDGYTKGFVGKYDINNWALHQQNSDGSTDVSQTPQKIEITSGNNGSNAFGYTGYSILTTHATTISFDWSYSTSDTQGAAFDPPTYYIEGEPEPLIFPSFDTNGADIQNGSESIIVPAGKLFYLLMYTQDNVGGSATVETESISFTDNFLGSPSFTECTNKKTVITDAPSIFPVGTTTVTWTITGENGVINTDTQQIIVLDNQLPTLTAKTDEIRNTDVGNCTFINTDIPNGIATDNCGIASYSYVLSGATTGTVSTLAGQVFNVGVTNISWTATDTNGNVSLSDDFTVTLVNTTREINILGNSVSILDGDVTPNLGNTTDFGSTAIPKTVTYTIENTGTEVLTISSITSSNTTDFAITGIVPTSVAAGANATFDVTFTPSGSEIRTATITINNNDCDEIVYDFVVQGIKPLDINLTSIDVLCNSDGSATANITGGEAPYTYLWSNGQTSATIINLSQGTYQVEVTDNNGDVVTKSIDVNNHFTVPIVSVLPTNSTCNGSNEGSLLVSTSSGTAPYTYTFSGSTFISNVTAASPITVSNLSVGTYTVTTTDANGCSTSTSVTLSEPDIIQVTNLVATNASCTTSADGSISLDVNGGTAPFTFLWNNGTTTKDLTNVIAGNYSLQITDANGCTVSVNQTISSSPDTQNPIITCPTNITTDNDPNVCGAILNFALPTVSDNCGIASLIQTAGIASGNLYPVGITTNTFVVTDNNGNTSTCSFDVTVNQRYELLYSSTMFSEIYPTSSGVLGNAISIKSNACAIFTGTNGEDFINTGKATVLNLATGLTASIIKVSDTELAFRLNGSATNNTISDNIENLTVIFNDAAFVGITAANVINSTKTDLAIRFLGVIDLDFFANAVSTSQIDLVWKTNSIHRAYRLYRNNILVREFSATRANYSDKNLNADTRYSYKLVGIVNQNTETDAQIANEWTFPEKPILLSTSTICGEGKTAISVQGSGFVYRLYDQETNGNLLLESNNSNFQLPSISQNTTFYVSVIGKGGKESDRIPVLVEVQPVFEAKILGEATRETCESSIELEAEEIENATYTWFRNGTNLGITTKKITATFSAEYQVRITKGVCSFISEKVRVKLNQNPVAKIQEQNGIKFCQNGTINAVLANENSSYEWLLDNVVIGNNQSQEVTQSGIYTLVLTSQNGCQARTEIEVIVTELPQNPVLEVTENTICPNTETTISIQDPQDNVVYEWFRNGRILRENTNQTSISTSIQGSYYIRAISNENNLCTSVSNEISINHFEINPIYLRISEDKKSLFLEDINGSQSEIASIEWYFDGEVKTDLGTNTEITPTEEGYYSSKITTQNGCIIQTRTVYFTVPKEEIITGEEDLRSDVFKIYPNPSNTGIFTIHFGTVILEDIQISIFDGIGRIIHTKTLEKANQEFED